MAQVSTVGQPTVRVCGCVCLRLLHQIVVLSRDVRTAVPQKNDIPEECVKMFLRRIANPEMCV